MGPLNFALFFHLCLPLCLSVGVEQGTLLSCVNDIAAATQHTVASHLAKRTHRAILFCKAKGLLPTSSPTLVSESLHSVSPGQRNRDFVHVSRFSASSQTELWKWRSPLQVLSGGVASNQYIRKALSIITDTTGLQLLCPPAKFCTDNGVMIAWNGVERLREGKGILPPNVDVRYEPKWVIQLWFTFLFYSLCCWFKSAFAQCCRAPLGVDLTVEVKAAAIRLPAVRMMINSWWKILIPKYILCMYFICMYIKQLFIVFISKTSHLFVLLVAESFFNQ